MNVKILSVYLCFAFISSGCGQKFDASTIQLDQVPVALRSTFVYGSQWSDKLGTNCLLLLQTTPHGITKNSEFLTINLNIMNFNSLDETKRRILWKYEDSVENCHEVNTLTAKFEKESFILTDLNNNGIAEVWVIYKMACRTSASPSKMVLIMHEGAEQSTISGQTKVFYKDGSYYGGKYKMDSNFNAAPKEFKDYGLKLWGKFVNEDWK